MTTAVTHQALAQMVTSVRVISIATVLETPRGDSVLLGIVEPGEVLAVLEQQGNWYLVLAPEGTDTWQRGWVRDRFVEIIGQTAPEPSNDPTARGTALRGFTQVGGNFFTTRDSFETVVGSQIGLLYGGGVHVAFGKLFV